jgi:hypothetical protein
MDNRSGREGLPKTNTALLYDSECDKVLKWGEPALFQEQKTKKKQGAAQHFIIERFKLHLDDKIVQKPELPPMFDYKKAIIDYLVKMRSVSNYKIFFSDTTNISPKFSLLYIDKGYRRHS